MYVVFLKMQINVETEQGRFMCEHMSKWPSAEIDWFPPILREPKFTAAGPEKMFCLVLRWAL